MAERQALRTGIYVKDGRKFVVDACKICMLLRFIDTSEHLQETITK